MKILLYWNFFKFRKIEFIININKKKILENNFFLFFNLKSKEFYELLKYCT